MYVFRFFMASARQKLEAETNNLPKLFFGDKIPPPPPAPQTKPKTSRYWEVGRKSFIGLRGIFCLEWSRLFFKIEGFRT
jgi:hypothetical protein